jgi:hypothetical protein
MPLACISAPEVLHFLIDASETVEFVIVSVWQDGADVLAFASLDGEELSALAHEAKPSGDAGRSATSNPDGGKT